ncbi:hypothetical protein F2Q70_00024068 [Brassica cretica]|uniref:Uncharacterized protein n=1 Tax=Brassica cretica TaxID=69181 RepID=A0A8S9GT89_BRACR|nr:hypothetical protein F2Q70_00024068 [Brassica cretica]
MLTLLFFSLGLLLLLGLLLKFAFADELIVLSASCRGLHPDFQEGSEARSHRRKERAVSLFPGDGVDYLIHNAAYEGPKSNAVDASEENLETTFGVNVFGTISLTKLVTPHMLKRGGGHFVVEHQLRKTRTLLRCVSSERCAELTIIAASHNLKEAWISHQPELLVMYLVQYMPSLGVWLMDKVGGKRVEVAEKKVSYKNWW